MLVYYLSSYVRQLGDNVKRSQEQCIKNGQWISKAPYGYKNVALPSGQKTIEINQEQAHFVVTIFEEYAKGNGSFQTIAEKIKAAGFPLTARGKSITDRTVELILKNPFYYGMMKAKGQLHPHKYPTLISEELFNTVQNIICKRYKSPIQYSGKPILLRGLITCKNCEGAVTGDIKKGKYVYYSCHNSKRTCTKKWVKEEALVNEMLSYFDYIQLTHEQINEIANYIEEYEAQEHEFVKNSQRMLNEKLNLTQERISKLIDMHIDGKLDAETYHFKLGEYKTEQQNLIFEIKSYDTDTKIERIAAQEVLEIARDAKQIFMSSKLEEKQQLLGFFFSNLTLNAEKLDLELREPFNLIANVQDQHIWRS
jgi:site-specific DNA recombinase